MITAMNNNTIKKGDRLATVSRYGETIKDATIYTVVRTTAKTGWLENGEKFTLSDPYLSSKSIDNRLEPVTDEIEAANDRRIQKAKEIRFYRSELSRLSKLVSRIEVGYFKCLSPESITRIADAIEKELAQQPDPSPSKMSN